MKIPSFLSLIVLLPFLFPTASLAQFIGSGPNLIAPPFVNPDSSNRYQIDSTVQCPSTTLNVSGFVGNGQDWVTNFPDSSAYSGRDNYGFVVGISTPIGGRLSKFCNEYAALRNEFERKRVESILLNNATTIINTCINLYNAGVDFSKLADNAEVNKVESLALLAGCKDLEQIIMQMNEVAKERKKKQTVEPNSAREDSQRVIESFEKPPLNINITND